MADWKAQRGIIVIHSVELIGGPYHGARLDVRWEYAQPYIERLVALGRGSLYTRRFEKALYKLSDVKEAHAIYHFVYPPEAVKHNEP